MKKSIAMFLCLAFAGTTLYAQSKKQKEPPPPPPPKMEKAEARPPVIISEKKEEDFYDRNPSVSRLEWKSPDKVIVIFKEKGKKKEEYDLSREVELDSFYKKYGDAPRLVPPPPPPKPEKEVQ